MNRIMRLALGIVLTALCLTTVVIGASRLLAGTLATGSIPAVMSYQGFLTDSNSQPISGTVKLDFAIYDAATGGALMISLQLENVNRAEQPSSHNCVVISTTLFSA